MTSQELLQGFIAESSDLLDDTEAALVGYPRAANPDEKTEIVNRVFRHFHSIKGSAGFIGLQDIAKLTHEAETLLDQFRKSGAKSISPEVISLLCRTVDFLRVMLSAYSGGTTDENSGKQLGDLIQDILKATVACRGGIKAPKPEKGKKKAEEDASARPENAETVRTAGPGELSADGRTARRDTQRRSVRLGKGTTIVKRNGKPEEEFSGRYVAEAQELLEQAEQTLLQIEQHPEMGMEPLHEALRCLHSFKGNSGIMSLPDLERLSHRLESELERSLGRNSGIETHSFDVILQMLDVLRQGVLDYGCGGTGAIPDIDGIMTLLGETLPSPNSAGQQGADIRKKWLRGDASEQEILSSVKPADVIRLDSESPFVPAKTGKEPSPPSPGEAQAPVPQEDSPAPKPKQSKGSTTIGLRGSQTRINPIPNPIRNDIRVDLNKLDMMLDLVGELVIAEAMVTMHPVVWSAENESLERAVHQLRRVANSLQDMAMSVRMVPLVTTFRRMIRLVYDLSLRAEKQVDLVLVGEDTEVDRTVIERISDPLVHIIRNAIDHGIESPEERKRLGKPEVGRIVIEGRHEGGEVWIVITDDGSGLSRKKILEKGIEKGMVAAPGTDLTDNQVYQMIFEPGFSTTTILTDISGRGVGMDVVRKNIEKLSGKIDIRTREGEGTAVIMRIPLTLAIIDGMLVKAGDTRYIIPLLAIRESLRPVPSQIISTPDGQELVKLRNDLIPIVRLNDLFQRVKTTKTLEEGILVVVEGEDGELVALFADELMGQQETVIKGLSGWLKKARGVSGCTILGDGEVGLILDIGEIIKKAKGLGQLTLPA